jgi:hypothetical protein
LVLRRHEVEERVGLRMLLAGARIVRLREALRRLDSIERGDELSLVANALRFVPTRTRFTPAEDLLDESASRKSERADLTG